MTPEENKILARERSKLWRENNKEKINRDIKKTNIQHYI
jgi:hypothetical protein